MTAVAAPLRIVAIAPLRFPIVPPFAGGLESAVWNEVRMLRARGHRVDLIATEGSDFLDPSIPAFTLPAADWAGDPQAADDTYPPGYLDRALPALGRALDLVGRSADSYDVIVNHCLHGLPLERAGSLGVPMVSTLHTPVVPELAESHHRAAGRRSRFLSVSRHTSATWQSAGIVSRVLHNGVDADTWGEGPGGERLVWFGRIVPEKAPHLALETARLLGMPLVVAGRIGDRDYYDREVAPRLDETRVHVGALDTPDLAALVGRSACTLTTPVWDEPFGLVTPESLLCGTPVAGFAAGGVTEIAEGTPGVELVAPGDLEALAAAVKRLVESEGQDAGSRRRIRAAAVERFSLTARAGALEAVLSDVADRGRADTETVA
ncbi:glycosyltransferase [Frondihabitans australicus]|uniref:D-inositol 3-phosphate glycosyltransferase n=1 Tax=Frondihabitans australicus TaxID=386892 RepID=A0A495II81_9MICO|nr:glycosyltransferase [Frondihabitans australicus]RKR74816.1 glycosyltransferase involved in cell wall biosynthesis [Frondihabitans australicus]